jgi:hypothetical protein
MTLIPVRSVCSPTRLLVVSMLLATPPAALAQITAPQVAVVGALQEDEDISAVAAAGDLLLVAADEGNAIQVLVKGPDGYRLSHTIGLLDDPDAEMDIEGLELLDDGAGTLTVVATGSHSTARKNPDDDKTRKKNRERLEEIKPEPDRAVYVRLQLEAASGRLVGAIERGSLRPFFDQNPYFRSTFRDDAERRPPAKEGGIDVEGLALAPDGRLVFGLRGPVLLGEYCPVVVADFEHPEQAEVRFVRLGGLGIRGMARVADGYLVLAGPVGDGEDYRLFLWDGTDMVPGTDAPETELVDLGAVPRPSAAAKPEGVTVLATSPAAYTVLVVFDSAPNGAPTELSVPKPE